MAEISAERDGLADGMPRDERGYWKPDKDFGVPNPVFTWPPNPRADCQVGQGVYLARQPTVHDRRYRDLDVPDAGAGAHEGIQRRLDCLRFSFAIR